MRTEADLRDLHRFGLTPDVLGDCPPALSETMLDWAATYTPPLHTDPDDRDGALFECQRQAWVWGLGMLIPECAGRPGMLDERQWRYLEMLAAMSCAFERQPQPKRAILALRHCVTDPDVWVTDGGFVVASPERWGVRARYALGGLDADHMDERLDTLRGHLDDCKIDCPQCGGTGEYVGLKRRGDCEQCGGRGYTIKRITPEEE